MKKFKALLTTAAVSLVGIMALSLGLGAKVSAACVNYNPNATTPTTPVFNNICNVPNGIGNEPDFVRVRKSSNGNDMDNQNNPAYTNAVSDVCASGSKFDVWTYVHNNAVSGSNNNGAGTAVAHNVMLSLNAQGLNTTNSDFTFMSSVSASNAAGVQDSATLSCNGHQVKLTLVPSSVHIYSQQYNWHDLADSKVNGGAFPIGSPTLGSGDQWGCWEYRVIVVYQVTAEEIPQQQPSTGVCKDIDFSADKRNVTVKINGDVSNAQIVAYKIDWGDNSTPSDKQSDSHTYSDSRDSANITASVQVKFADGHTEWKSADSCTKLISFTKPPQTPPAKLVNTGPGSELGIFAGVTLLGAVAHRMRTLRKLGRTV